MFKEETWIDIYGYENQYRISNFGRIYSCKNNIIMKLYKDAKGYMKITLNNNDGGHTYSVHKLVAAHFIPNPGLRDSINHIDGNPENNYYKNLEWTTPLENTNHAWKNKLATAESKQRKVYKYNLKGEFVQEYDSLQKAAKDVGGTHSNISSCCYGKRHKAYGFIWSFDKKDKIDTITPKKIMAVNIEREEKIIFNSIKEAALHVRPQNEVSARVSINACLRHALQQAYGYFWEEI